MTYEIRVGLTGDEAEADTPEAALLAASTLLDDAFDAIRCSIQILRDGRSDVELTRIASRGRLTVAA